MADIVFRFRSFPPNGPNPRRVMGQTHFESWTTHFTNSLAHKLARALYCFSNPSPPCFYQTSQIYSRSLSRVPRIFYSRSLRIEAMAFATLEQQHNHLHTVSSSYRSSPPLPGRATLSIALFVVPFTSLSRRYRHVNSQNRPLCFQWICWQPKTDILAPTPHSPESTISLLVHHFLWRNVSFQEATTIAALQWRELPHRWPPPAPLRRREFSCLE